MFREIQDGPLTLTNGVITPISQVITPFTHVFSAIYGDPFFTPIKKRSWAYLVVNRRKLDYFFLCNKVGLSSSPFTGKKTKKTNESPLKRGHFNKGINPLACANLTCISIILKNMFIK